MKCVISLALFLLLWPAATYAGVGVDLFTRGDVNTDGSVDVVDVVVLVETIFNVGDGLLCPDAADANDDGSVDVADVPTLLMYLFGFAVPLSAPFPTPGVDPTADTLFCGCLPRADVGPLLQVLVPFSFDVCIPTIPVDLGIATVDVCDGLDPACAGATGCNVQVEVATIDFDPVTLEFDVTGSIVIDPFSIDTGPPLGGCSGDLISNFTITVAAVTTPVAPGAGRVDSFDVVSSTPNLNINLVTGTACFVLGPVVALLETFLADQVTTLVDQSLLQLLDSTLLGVVICD